MSAVDENGCGGIHTELKPFSAVRKGYTYFEAGDVLFAKITPCMQNGKIAVARNLTEDFGFGSTEFHVLRPVPGLMADWVQRYISQPWLLREAMAHFTGSVGQQRVPESFLANLKIPVPSTAKQQQIVASLDQKMFTGHQTRLAAEGQLAAINKLPSALLREAFFGRM